MAEYWPSDFLVNLWGTRFKIPILSIMIPLSSLFDNSLSLANRLHVLATVFEEFSFHGYVKQLVRPSEGLKLIHNGSHCWEWCRDNSGYFSEWFFVVNWPINYVDALLMSDGVLVDPWVHVLLDIQVIILGFYRPGTLCLAQNKSCSLLFQKCIDEIDLNSWQLPAFYFLNGRFSHGIIRSQEAF